MNEGLVPRRYAKALLEYACDISQESRLYTLMKELAHSFDTTPQLQKTLNNPAVKDELKQQLIATAAGAKLDADTTFARMLAVLQLNSRFGSVHAIALAYIDAYRAAKHIKVVKVQSAAPLATESLDRLKTIIKKHLQGASMEFSHTVNPHLIGGFTVQTGNELFDASVANKLKQMRLNLITK